MRLRLALGLVFVAMATLACVLGARATGLLRTAEQRTLAERFAIRGADQPDDLAVVAIDDDSLARLEHSWPLPRSRHAELVKALHAAGAAQIVYDVQFTEPTTEREDLALYDALGEAGGAVLATTSSRPDGSTDVLGGEENLKAIGARAAAANFPDGPSGTIERFPAAIGKLPSLAVVSAERSGGPRLAPGLFKHGGAPIDFRGPPGTIATYSFADVLDGAVGASRLRGRIVVVGVTAPSLQDLHFTPTSSGPMAGVEVQANAVWSALHGVPLRDGSPFLALGLIVLCSVAIPLSRLRLRLLASVLCAPALAAAVLVADQLAFNAGHILPVAAPMLGLVLGTGGTIVVSHLGETRLVRRAARDRERLEGLVAERTSELRDTQLEILTRLARAAEWRDQDTGAHVERIGTLSRRLGLALGMSEAEAEMLRHAATAHDIGKIGVPDGILLKPGGLTEAERAVMQRHAELGAGLLEGSTSALLRLAEQIALTHHERWDGAGYPRGLAGEAIPLAGRICAVCDVFDALVSERPYKRAWPLEDALAELERSAGAHFDPRIVEVFLPLAPALHGELYAAEAPAGGGTSGRAPGPPGALAA